MDNKKNLPNIPIYIGDWERDCNVLSLESEAAWMRVVFKLWTKGKQNTIKMPAKSLQNLWRCSPQKMDEILQDLIFNDIAEITVNSGFVEFTCRRFVKENALSKIRSEAAKGDGTKIKPATKPKQTTSKAYNKTGQNADNDNETVIDIDNVIEIKGGTGGNFSRSSPEQNIVTAAWVKFRQDNKMTHATFGDKEKYALADIASKIVQVCDSMGVNPDEGQVSKIATGIFLQAQKDKWLKDNFILSNINTRFDQLLTKLKSTYERVTDTEEINYR